MKIIYYTAIFQSLLPLLYYWYIRKNLIQDIKPILPFIILCFIAGIYEFVFTHLMFINSIPWFFTYDVLAFLSILYFFFKVLDTKVKGFFFISIFLYVTIFYFAVKNCTLENYLSQVSYLFSFTTLFIFISSVAWFKKVLTQNSKTPLIQNHNFYFVFGILLYYSGIVVLFLLSNSLYHQEKSNFQNYWFLNLLFNIFLKTFLILGLWKSSRS